MEVIIVHSHLNPGGVTRIIESQVESLHRLPVKVVAGDCSNPEQITSRGAEYVEFAPLNYLEHKPYSIAEINQKLIEITSFLKNLTTSDSILHIHNLNLGKNPVVTYAVYQLAKKGMPVFNHAHDFAEDRPANLKFLKEIIEDIFKEKLNDVLYPDFPNYHFGVLNSFDKKRLENYGVQQDRILWLPNPVTFDTEEDISNKKKYKTEICSELNLDEKKLLVTYPVRVIQRKNIGEFILLSVLFANDVQFVVTQPPKNPVEIELYEKWLKFCHEKKIAITFEAGQKVNFEKLIIASDFCITTSYREGFGMVYLEPWLLNTPVVGRNIDFLTNDFQSDGFRFSALYDEITVPGQSEDFKNLDMHSQMEIIDDVLSGKIKKEQVYEQNPVLSALFKNVPEQVSRQNKSIIKNNYSLEKYGIKLQNRYKEMVG